MRDFCQRHDIRPYRPTYRYLRGDPEEQRVAQAELAALKKTRVANLTREQYNGLPFTFFQVQKGR